MNNKKVKKVKVYITVIEHCETPSWDICILFSKHLLVQTLGEFLVICQSRQQVAVDLQSASNVAQLVI